MASLLTRPSVSRQILYLYLTFNILGGSCVLAASSNKLLLRVNDQFKNSDYQTGSIIFANVPSSVSLRPTAGSIKLRDIPQVITLALGFSSLQDVDWKGLLVGDLFNHPKANILFIIEGLGEGHVLSFLENNESYPIVKNAAEVNLDVVRLSPERNFVRHISTILKEKPLVVSLSAEEKLVRAASATGLNAHTVTWDSKEQLFRDSKSKEDGIAMSKIELLKKFQNADFGEGVRYLSDKSTFVVSVSGIKDVAFDMDQVEDFIFFAELEMVRYVYDKVKTLDDLLHDDYPDFFTFGLTALKGLSLRYGNDSQQFAAALNVLKSFVPKMSLLFNELFGGQALAEVVNFQRETNELDKKFSAEVNDIYKHVEDHLRSPSLNSFKNELPEVNFRENLEDHAVAQICDSVQNKLLAMQSKLEVSCDVNRRSHKRHRRDIRETPNQDCKDNKRNLAAIDNVYDSSFPPIFNIILWLMIVIGLALYVVCLVLWYMDPGRDSIIYRVTSQRMKTE